jgi:hypothetical protein
LKTLLAVALVVVAAVLAARWLERREQQVAVDKQAAETERTGLAAPSDRGLYDCTCDYLTDTDLTGEERVRVCADGLDEAVQRGRGCAYRHAPGTVNRCTCVLFGKYDCAENDCRSNR